MTTLSSMIQLMVLNSDVKCTKHKLLTASPPEANETTCMGWSAIIWKENSEEEKNNN